MQGELFTLQLTDDLISVDEAAHFLSVSFNKSVTVSNISYLVQYGRIQKFSKNGNTAVSKKELFAYYNSNLEKKKKAWESFGDQVNWQLSFEQYKEAETTKHVHRLHPYKGKFIPQLVEYFLDTHTDELKTNVFFHKGDIILDPFCGSGTTLVQANELGINAIGIDVSAFNALISNVKIADYNLSSLDIDLNKITQRLQNFKAQGNISIFESELNDTLSIFNKEFFPSPDFKIKVRKKQIDEKSYADEKLKLFLDTFEMLVKKYNIKIKQNNNNSFLSKWYIQNTRDEIDFLFSEIEKIKDPKNKEIAKIILSRAMRSCRATTHADLATLQEPVFQPYYCKKHGKICKPLFSVSKWWNTYRNDTIKRLSEFKILRTDTFQTCLVGDSRLLDIFETVASIDKIFSKELNAKKIKGIFSSPPYVGLIDYHEQHAYAYELFNLKRNDKKEIGPLSKGQSLNAQDSYVQGVTEVLKNCKKFLADDYDVFLVANDKFNLYPKIAKNCNMEIVNEYHRPVLNRTEKDRSAYYETIFHMKEKQSEFIKS